MNSTETTPARDFLWQQLESRAPREGLDWLRGRLDEFDRSGKDRTFYLTFSAIPRYLGKKKIDLPKGALDRAAELRPGFHPAGWQSDRLARVWLLLHLPHADEESFLHKMEMLFDTADMGELVALYSALPLLPYPKRFVKRTAEGIRTNMTVVFDAIALDNPYPADYLDDAAWNQMVLKAAFMDRPIYRIQGLKRRANAELAQIISDYAHERWAAGRVVSPEFWRPVGPFVDQRLAGDLQRLFESDHPLQRQAAALVCADSSNDVARDLLARHPRLKEKVDSGALTWDHLARDWWEAKKMTSD